jgi:hypothetical protein
MRLAFGCGPRVLGEGGPEFRTIAGSGRVASATVDLLSNEVQQPRPEPGTCRGILSNATLRSATAPFSDAANAIFGGTWAGDLMAIAVIVSGFGALNGWTTICAEMPLAAAKDGLFPARFKELSGGSGGGRLQSRSPEAGTPPRLEGAA